MERFAKICSALNDSVRLIRKIQIIGGASPEGGGLLNGRLSEKRAEVLWRYISPCLLYTSPPLPPAVEKVVLAFGVDQGEGQLSAKPESVSYTHLDVYKRQAVSLP